jgi:hypothetical protein
LHQAHPPLTELEKELLRRGLDFYDEFSLRNGESVTGNPLASRQG